MADEKDKTAAVTREKRASVDEAKAKEEDAGDELEVSTVDDMRAKSIAALASTIPGGAYLADDGKTWHNANGEPLTKEQIQAAKAHIKTKEAAAAELNALIDKEAKKA